MSDIDVKSFATEGDRDIHILYGSQSGNSEGLADKWKREAIKYGLNPTVHDMDGFDINSMSEMSRVMIVCSTWGEGEMPDNGNTINREWRPIPPPKDGHGYNHLVFISRRHLIDEMELDEDGVPNATGNIHIALEPLTIQKNFVGRLKTCKWC